MGPEDGSNNDSGKYRCFSRHRSLLPLPKYVTPREQHRLFYRASFSELLKFMACIFVELAILKCPLCVIMHKSGSIGAPSVSTATRNGNSRTFCLNFNIRVTYLSLWHGA
jgi:hypothetical protein